MKNLKKILSLLLVVSMIVPGFAFAAEAEEGVITRIAGENRYGTAIEVSKAANESADTVILATGEDYADALAGNVLAKAKNAPILLTNGKVLRADILAEIERLGAENVIILGGENAIAASMEGKLEAEDLTVERLEGKNRFATAVEIAEEANSDAKEAFLVTGRDFADALAIGSVAARDNTPILLTEKDSLPAATKEALAGMTKVTIVGGTSVVSNEVKAEMEALDIEVNRVEGDNREKTAKAIAEEYFANPENVVVASGESYQDAMVGGYLAAKKDAPVMLIRDIDKIEPAIEYLEASQASKGYILGGEAVVSEEVEAKVEEAILFEEVEELEVVSVSAINESSVTVKINPLEEDLLGATIEVLDNEGNVVEVKPFDIAEGDTEVQFTFKDEQEFEGVWTVAGIEIDFDLLNNLKAFEGATGQLDLNKALKDLGIKNVEAKNINKYKEAKTEFINALEALEGEEFYGVKEGLTVEAIQNLIDKVNSDLLTEEESKAIAKKVTGALNNEILLLEALEDPAFARVNPEWLLEDEGYKAKLEADDAETDTVEDIQNIINEVNGSKVTAAISAIEGEVDKDELNELKALIERYATPTDKGEQTEATKTALKGIEIQSAIADVLAASTPNILKSRVTALAALVNDKEQLDMEDYVDANGKYYLAQIDGSDEEVTSVDGVATAIEEGNEAAKEAEETEKEEELENALKAVNEAETADELLAALKAYPELKNVLDANKDAYFEAEGDELTGENIQEFIDGINKDVRVEAGFVENATDLNKALEVEGLETITFEKDIAIEGPVELKSDLTLDGNGYALFIRGTEYGASSAKGLYIPKDTENVVVKNLTVTGTHKDNLIEIYSDATLIDVTATGGNKAGIYVNNNGTGTITVNFENITTARNGWDAGVGLVSREEGSKIVANFSGSNSFGEEVAVYTDDIDKYAGEYDVNGMSQYRKELITDELDDGATQTQWKWFTDNDKE